MGSGSTYFTRMRVELGQMAADVCDIDFDCIFTAGQAGVGSNLTKRLQSGEGGIDFDCIFTVSGRPG